jgi:hypothetical protein
MKLYHAVPCCSKSKHFYPWPPHIEDHLCRASDLMLVRSGTKVETFSPSDGGGLTTLPPSGLMSVRDPLPTLSIYWIANCGTRNFSKVQMTEKN